MLTRPSNHDRGSPPRSRQASEPQAGARVRRPQRRPPTRREARPIAGPAVWRRVKCDIRSSAREGEGVAVGHPGDPRKDMPHRRLVRLDSHAGRHIARDDELIAKLPRLPRGRLNADMRCDASEDDGPPTPRRLSSASRSVRKNAPQVDLVIRMSPGSARPERGRQNRRAGLLAAQRARRPGALARRAAA